MVGLLTTLPVYDANDHTEEKFSTAEPSIRNKTKHAFTYFSAQLFDF